MKKPIKWSEWFERISQKTAYESDIVLRSGIFLINLECPNCNSHLFQPDVRPKKPKEIPVLCMNCDFKDKRPAGKYE